MLGSILDLGEVEVEEIMVHRKYVKMIDFDMPIDELVNQVMNSPFTRTPVWKDDKDNIVCVIHSRLVLKELLSVNGDVSKVDINKAMMDPWFITETTCLSDQLEAFRKRREHFSIVFYYMKNIRQLQAWYYLRVDLFPKWVRYIISLIIDLKWLKGLKIR